MKCKWQLAVLTLLSAFSSSRLFAQAPTITSLSPSSAVVGSSVTITGSNFGSTPGSSTITFNGSSATPASWNSVSIVVPVPSGATSGNVVVTVSGVSSSGTSFIVLNTPVVSTVSPSAGLVGASVTISGMNFGSSQGSSTVAFNGTLATPSSWSATSVVAPVPPGATSGQIAVTIGSQSAYAPFFTVGTAPAGWLDADVGAVALAGSSSYSNGALSVTGACLPSSGAADPFHFVYQQLSGDRRLVAQVTMPTATGANAALIIP